MSSPAIAKNAVAVGALDASYVKVAQFSSRGPTPDGRLKPDLVAPGSSLVSAADGEACGTVTMSGTSMATPIVTAAAALVRQYFREGFFPSGAKTRLKYGGPTDSFPCPSASTHSG